jgi:hypothetical protein
MEWDRQNMTRDVLKHERTDDAHGLRPDPDTDRGYASAGRVTGRMDTLITIFSGEI